jgi:hypothetical protein
MKCSNCGEKNLADTKFCVECGRPLAEDLPSYMYRDDPSIWDKLNEVSEEIKKNLNFKNYKQVLANRDNPVTGMLIIFAAWLMLRTIGIIPFLILVRILAFLMGVPGLIFLLVMTYVYTTHEGEIREKMEEIKGMDYRISLKEIVDTIEKKTKEIRKETRKETEEEKEEKDTDIEETEEDIEEDIEEDVE